MKTLVSIKIYLKESSGDMSDCRYGPVADFGEHGDSASDSSKDENFLCTN
jgi:hypothetical protein